MDTSVWIDHFRKSDPVLSRLLYSGDVVIHPFVIGELVLGRVPGIMKMLTDLQDLPQARRASDQKPWR
ncbi:MAG TPA: hypothetical protein VGC77_16455 [Rhodopseudomonas sp.]|uniref:type II toxin-antitoxin system VapC family toxin n=1 Tax=Rhodopseudomonas sp. TaxID=1078 RepID=UPI002ED82309